LPEPTSKEKAELIMRHARMLVDFKGEYIGIREMRRHFSSYTKGMPSAAEMRGQINSVESLKEIENLIKKYYVI
jgi:tRNA-dihydrouridine synthase